jgi:glycerol-1-phosphate dehydrogenase [NAD(P)+]
MKEKGPASSIQHPASSQHPASGILGISFDCACGKRHEVPVKSVLYADDALARLSGFMDQEIKGKTAAVLSDTRTYSILGLEVERIVTDAGWKVDSIVVPDGPHGSPICDDKTHHVLEGGIGNPDVFLSVGSGVINDLTKWIAFSIGKPYIAVATAATMNGYTAANVAPTLEGVKSLIRAQAPLAVFAVPAVIEGAPFRLTASGLGDAVAKSVSAADWKLNHLLFGEYYCRFSADIISDMESMYFDHPEKVKNRSPEGIKAVFDALIYSGLAMTLVGTSAPASGGEHLFSHTLDMMSAVDGVPHDLHGRQVGLGTLFSAVLYERLQKLDVPVPSEMPKMIDRTFWGPLADAVHSQYAAKKAHLEKMTDLLSSPSEWRRIRNLVCAEARAPKKIADCLSNGDAAHRIEDIGCSRRRAREAILHMHEIRKRPTVVDLAWLAGILPEAVDEIMDEWLL